mmetsp:Transcript_1658/g.5262  ORF Transcript_1658/g.5262 Transcript_1658/m.5262 type:complete len:95 (-) Transcript_1658:255-539(-)|eukprot:scaffold123426_cov31-Tisochrysis_lutea.AAC.3
MAFSMISEINAWFAGNGTSIHVRYAAAISSGTAHSDFSHPHIHYFAHAALLAIAMTTITRQHFDIGIVPMLLLRLGELSHNDNICQSSSSNGMS